MSEFKQLFGSTSKSSNTIWMSSTDLMSGLMIVFMFIAITYMMLIDMKSDQTYEIVKEWDRSKMKLAEALHEEFDKDLMKWEAMINDSELSIKFSKPEILFKPSFVGLENVGIDGYIVQSIKNSDIDVRKSLYENIVLSGGTTMIPGLVKRIGKEVKKSVPDNFKVRIIASPERKYSVWIGGSILSSLPSFQDMWITKKEYTEFGKSIIHRKCF